MNKLLKKYNFHLLSLLVRRARIKKMTTTKKTHNTSIQTLAISWHSHVQIYFLSQALKGLKELKTQGKCTQCKTSEISRGPFTPYPGLVSHSAQPGLGASWCIYICYLDQTCIASLDIVIIPNISMLALLPHHSSVFQTADNV